MKYADTRGKDFCVSWLPDGKSFIIKDPEYFARHVIPKFFRATKFSSFTRKLYRWGFRQINRGIGPDDPIIFGNEHFDRDAEHLISKMRSVTAESVRKTTEDPLYAKYAELLKTESSQQNISNVPEAPKETRNQQVQAEQMQRDTVFPHASLSSTSSALNMILDESKKTLLLDQLMQQKALLLLQQRTPVLFGASNSGYNLPLSASDARQLEQGNGFHYPTIALNSSSSGTGSSMSAVPTSLAAKLELLNKCQQQQSLLLCQHPPNLWNQLSLQNELLARRSLQYPDSQSTADILNAAVAALRYAK